MTPADFDKQSPVKIDRWIDIDSEEAKAKDPDRAFAKKLLRIGFEDGWLQTDSDGRVWGFDPKRNIYYPTHFEDGKKLLGYRIAKKAAN